jgi:superkiller protein 3
MRRRIQHSNWISIWIRVFVGFCCLFSLGMAQVREVPTDEHLVATTKALKTQQQLLADLASARQEFQSHASAEACLRLALALKEVGNKTAASELLDQALKMNSRLPQAWYEKGLIASEQEDWSHAADLFRDALSIRPDNSSTCLALGEMLLRMGDFVGAAAQFRKASELNSASAGAHQGLGLVDLQQGHPHEAREEFRSALAIRPDYLDAKKGLARALANEHSWDQAAALLREILAANPDSLEETSSLGTALSNLGDQAGAAKQFSRAQQLSNQQMIRLRAEGECNWGVSLRNDGKLQDAESAFRNALSEDPIYCEVHDDLGEVLWMQKKFAEALSEFRTAVDCGPGSASARNNLGSALLYDQHAVDSAIIEFRAATAASPGFALAHFNLGKALAAKQEYVAADPEFRAAIALDPTLAAAHLNLGIVLALRNKSLSKEARDEIQSGLRLDPRLRDVVPQQYLAELH